MRCLSAVFATIALAACGAEGGENADELPDEAKAVPGVERIACATAVNPRFERACTVEVASGEGGTIVTLRAPGGGFRRLLITSDGRGVVAADGAEPAVVTAIGDNAIEVRLGDGRYRLPARVQDMTP